MFSASARASSKCSPRERGCADAAHPPRHAVRVFPARAGVCRPGRPARRRRRCVPRASGGVPLLAENTPPRWRCSPRERGCARRPRSPGGAVRVFPARAGVCRYLRTTLTQGNCVPRASGGVPRTATRRAPRRACSPRERGCAAARHHRVRRGLVFPARAGVCRWSLRPRRRTPSVPRASGGVPRADARSGAAPWCSPRERGCAGSCGRCGPRRWVFPARAGVCREGRGRGRRGRCVPRASGGVPASASGLVPARRCSPRERGCAAGRRPRPQPARVFPARAGVCRTAFRLADIRRSVPRASGGEPRSGGAG